MDERLWNLLHDGSVASASVCVPGAVCLAICIPYIRQMFPADGNSEDGGVCVVLHDCSIFRFEAYEGSAVEELDEIGALELEILRS